MNSSPSSYRSRLNGDNPWQIATPSHLLCL